MRHSQGIIGGTLIVLTSCMLFFTGLSVITFRRIADAPITYERIHWSVESESGALLLDENITLAAKKVYYEGASISVNYTCTITCRTGSPMNLTIIGVSAWAEAEDNFGALYTAVSSEEMWAEPLKYENVDFVVLSGTTELQSHYGGPPYFRVSNATIILYVWGEFQSSHYVIGPGRLIGPGMFGSIFLAGAQQHPATWVAISATTIGLICLALVSYALIIRTRRLPKTPEAHLITR